MRVLVAVAMLALSSVFSWAQELTVVCKFERTFDDMGKSSPTTGQMSVSITYMSPAGKPKNVKIKTSKAPCYEFVGDGDDMKIEGTCTRFIENGPGPKTKMTSMLAIDRVRGSFEQIIQFNDKGGMVHNGQCAQATRAF
jgi:hypothetical protein